MSAELPGLDEKKLEKKEKGNDYYHIERSYGSFCRTVPLNAEIDTNGIKAAVKNGVLTLTLPKIEPEKKKIDVMAG
ncbi:MAG: Hsp20/alpha crystallin family protein [Candidatus Desulfatibia sp.]|uniref:Hsp20/alpha crystallin family protein n=1 Tax=Candidatus Desulfatibia sp. TaxID=3101189 RepID=UPI002F3471D3